MSVLSYIDVKCFIANMKRRFFQLKISCTLATFAIAQHPTTSIMDNITNRLICYKDSSYSLDETDRNHDIISLRLCRS